MVPKRRRNTPRYPRVCAEAKPVRGIPCSVWEPSPHEIPMAQCPPTECDRRHPQATNTQRFDCAPLPGISHQVGTPPKPTQLLIHGKQHPTKHAVFVGSMHQRLTHLRVRGTRSKSTAYIWTHGVPPPRCQTKWHPQEQGSNTGPWPQANAGIRLRGHPMRTSAARGPRGPRPGPLSCSRQLRISTCHFLLYEPILPRFLRHLRVPPISRILQRQPHQRQPHQRQQHQRQPQ